MSDLPEGLEALVEHLAQHRYGREHSGPMATRWSDLSDDVRFFWLHYARDDLSAARAFRETKPCPTCWKENLGMSTGCQSNYVLNQGENPPACETCGGTRVVPDHQGRRLAYVQEIGTYDGLDISTNFIPLGEVAVFIEVTGGS